MSVHAGPEVYQEIKRLLGIETNEDWREDEPIFILRAQDRSALETLDFYTEEQVRPNNDPTFMDNLRRVRNAFEDWQIKHQDRVKRAD